jgi:hypothetical protein
LRKFEEEFRCHGNLSVEEMRKDSWNLKQYERFILEEKKE